MKGHRERPTGRRGSDGARRTRATRVLLAMLLLFAALFATGPAAAQVVYRWVDEQGVEHFSELPPDGIDAETYLITGGAADQSGIDPRAGEREPGDDENSYRAYEEQARLAMEQRQERVVAAQREAAEQERQAAICESQRAQLARLIPRVRILVRDDEGNVRQLDSDERLSMIDEIEQYLAENCD